MIAWMLEWAERVARSAGYRKLKSEGRMKSDR